MDVSDWPMDNEIWKEEYFNYENEYRSSITDDQMWNLVEFNNNNIVLNN